MKTYTEATPYERMFMPTPATDDAYWCSTQSVVGWVEFYRECQYSDPELLTRLGELIDGTYQPIYSCEIPLRIAAIQQLLGLSEAPAGWVCPTCTAREKKKAKTGDTAQTSLFA